jgi:transcriptional regulator with XRE-family HTH domain
MNKTVQQDMEKTQNIGNRLRQERQRLELTVEALAKSLGVHKNSVLGYEADQSIPSCSIIPRLRAAGVDWIYVMSGQRIQEIAADGFDWGLLKELHSLLSSEIGDRRLQVPSDQFVELLRAAYTMAALRSGRAENSDVRQLIGIVA